MSERKETQPAIENNLEITKSLLIKLLIAAGWIGAGYGIAYLLNFMGDGLSGTDSFAEIWAAVGGLIIALHPKLLKSIS